MQGQRCAAVLLPWGSWVGMFLAQARSSYQRQEKSGAAEWQLQTELGASSTAAQGLLASQWVESRQLVWDPRSAKGKTL